MCAKCKRFRWMVYGANSRVIGCEFNHNRHYQHRWKRWKSGTLSDHDECIKCGNSRWSVELNDARARFFTIPCTVSNRDHTIKEIIK